MPKSTKEVNLLNSTEERGERTELIPIKKQIKELSLDELREQENLMANLISAEQKRLEKLKKKNKAKKVENQIKKTEEYIDILEAEKASLTENITKLEKNQNNSKIRRSVDSDKTFISDSSDNLIEKRTSISSVNSDKTFISNSFEYRKSLEQDLAEKEKEIKEIEGAIKIFRENSRFSEYIDPMKEQLSRLEKEKKDIFDELRLMPIEKKKKKNLSLEELKEEENIARKQLLEANRDLEKLKKKEKTNKVEKRMAETKEYIKILRKDVNNITKEIKKLQLEEEIKDIKQGLENLKRDSKEIDLEDLSDEIEEMNKKLKELEKEKEDITNNSEIRRSVDSDKTFISASSDTSSKGNKFMSKIKSIIPKDIRNTIKTISDTGSLKNIKNTTKKLKKGKEYDAKVEKPNKNRGIIK